MFDQNWHHLYSSSAGGKDLSSDTQIKVIDSMESEICTKMLRNLSEKLRAKFLRLHVATPNEKPKDIGYFLISTFISPMPN